MTTNNAPRSADSVTASTHAGHVRISDITLERGDGYVDIGFDVAWLDSWRYADPRDQGANWDAAWIFIKYQTQEKQTVPDTEEVRASLDRGEIEKLLGAVAGVLGAPSAPPSLPPPLRAGVDALKQKVGEIHGAIRSAGPPRGPEWLRGLKSARALQKGNRWVLRQETRSRSSGASSDETAVEYLEAKLLPPEEGEKQGTIQLSKPSGWKHAKIDSVTRVPEGAVIDLPSDKLGFFIYRAEPGAGPVRFERVVVRCNPGAADRADFEGNLTLWIFGVEMVLIPEGPFSAGDPAGPSGPHACFYDASTADGEADRSYRVESEEPIALGASGTGKRLCFDSSTAIGSRGDMTSPVPEPFPKGYRAFYVMKYQITQAQYGDLVNTLPGRARTVRFSYWYGDYRYTIFMTQSGYRVTLRPERACNWLSWMDGAAYACWSALRPLTELEFEKACRGPEKAAAGEYAWGTTNAQQAQVIFGDEDRPGVSVSGNCSYGNFRFLGGDGGSGPLPGAVFGASERHVANASYGAGKAYFSVDEDGSEPVLADLRERRGASFYGVMALSGNLWEWCVSAGDATGRRFSGNHGTGALDDSGNPDTAALGWPGLDTLGAGVRGGSWYTAVELLRLADRAYGSGLEGYSTRSHDFGFRCARTAP